MHVKDPVVHVRVWRIMEHKITNVPPKTECACPSGGGGGIKNGHIGHPSYAEKTPPQKTHHQAKVD